MSYKSSGVDLDAAEAATKKISALAKSTFNAHVLNEIGLFAGFYEIDTKKYPEPVLVTSIDGVGTKLKIAFIMDIHDTVGQDLVNHCVNDIMTTGADPLAFTDYIGTLELQPEKIAAIIKGMSIACRENDCALIGGETAEMPGFYAPGEYDLAGSIFGIINKSDVINGSNVTPGDVLLGIPSNGLHTNGYSLARKVILEVNGISLDDYVAELSASWGEVLLKIHKSYKKAIELVRFLPGLHGISHITGGGIAGNTVRLLRAGLTLKIDWTAWIPLPEFQLLQQLGNISNAEMRRAFNLGIGLVLIVSQDSVDSIMNILKKNGEIVHVIGQVVKSDT
ncbi:phosphoribosylformylglycinamidine cyclo-ligase [candidate division KSB1 bacterium]|nr:phosphoribosylformylglycinamidine cyclo-ligase [candidate division KSB1 bacterium]RQW00492.1 MAG: phosphoribosylformylglycinamidine cyclo-ligase [candidate division KSB1 bacterium]